jgi:phosphatidylinositol alpha-1,6-mannosyltransferase
LKILFLTLKTFSASGGIEKACRIAGMAMNEYCKESQRGFSMYSMYDEKKIKTEPYLPRTVFKGFAGRRWWWFIIKSVQRGIKSRVVVFSHINLLLAGYFVKLFSPKTKVILTVHDIDGSKQLSIHNKRMLKYIDLVITVSDLAKEKMKLLFDLPGERFHVLNNCLDPFLPTPSADESRRSECRSSYGIAENDFVLMTLSSLSSKGKSRGYDKVLVAVKKLHATFPNLKYLFVGKYDDDEKIRLNDVIRDLGIEEDVIFTGFVPDSVLGDYYNMSDLYIVPGEKEGFGFRYIEALYYNKPVIAGRVDGDTDNQYGNSLGTIIDIRNQDEIITTIQKVIANLKAFMPDPKLVLEKFSYTVYKNKWKKILDDVQSQKLKVLSS